MSLLDLFRKKGPLAGAGETAPTPIPAPTPLPDAVPVPVAAVAEAATNSVVVGTQSELPSAEQPSPEEPRIRVFDDFGREVLIPVQQWRRELLPQALQQAHNTPDALSAILLDALQTGAGAELLPAAAHLQTIDPAPERGAAVHGLVLLAANQPAQAEDVLVTYLGQFGPSATVLTHLARAQAAQERLEEADATLWRALEANPNDDGALGLYAARNREREGDFGWQSALERAATLPGAWLPLMWLGRSALEAHNRSLAVGLYKQAIERAGRPAPTLLLQGISGDLGLAGLLDDALRLVRPVYDPAVHGLAVGNNLLRATLDSGHSAEALTLLRELGKLNRSDFAEPLRAWEVEIRRRDLMAQAAETPPQPQLLRIAGPVWLPPDTPSRQLYPTATPRRARVLFLGSSVSLPPELPQEAAAVLPDTAGRLSRALPLFLAEGAYTLLALDTQTLVPWADIAGFAMLSQPWPDDAAAAYAREAGAGAAVTSHIQATPEGAAVTLRLISAASPQAPSAADLEPDGAERTGSPPEEFGAVQTEAALADRPAVPGLDAPVLTAEPAAHAASSDTAPPQVSSPGTTAEPVTLTLHLAWPDLHTGAQGLWAQLAHHLVAHFGDTPEPPQFGRYTPPRGADLNIYLRLLEQLLGMNCAMTSRNAPLLVTGERDTVRALLDLAVRYPASLPVRLMLGETLLRLRALHPEVLAEFAQPLRLLNERHPFPDPEAASLLQAQQAAALNPPPEQA